MRICVIGCGHVGLVTACGFAHRGHRVVGVDSDRKKILALQAGRTPFHEPGLPRLLAEARRHRRIAFTENIREGVKDAEVVFICVGTPPRADGSANLEAVRKVALEIRHHSRPGAIVVEKSTVPVQTGRWLRRLLQTGRRRLEVASNPEFLAEGTALRDVLRPSRIVLGVSSRRAEKILRRLYRGFRAPLIVTSLESAEIIKHAANGFLSMKISYINAVGRLCEKVGADVTEVARGIGLDPRIGPSFLNAGLGFGGYCFPKDVQAFYAISRKIGRPIPLLREVLRINRTQRVDAVRKLRRCLGGLRGRRIALFGLSFKPGTDDVRFSPALDLARRLRRAGADVVGYDPVAEKNARRAMPGLKVAASPLEAARAADAAVIATDWPAFARLNWSRLRRRMKDRRPVLLDGRNLLDPARLRRAGFRYLGTGR